MTDNPLVYFDVLNTQTLRKKLAEAEAALAAAQNEVIVRTTAIANLHSVIAERDRALARADALLRASRVLLVGYRDGTFPEWPEGLLEAITVYVADVDAYLRDREGGAA